MANVITFAPVNPANPGTLQAVTSLRFRGVWDPLVAYNVNDGVFFNGSSYVGTSINTGRQPDASPSTWQLIAQGGTSGPGTTGPDTLSSIAAAIGSVLYKAGPGSTAWGGLIPGVAGQALITNGPNQAPTWGTITIPPLLTPGVAQQIFPATAMYTPNPAMRAALFEAFGAGAGGGGAANSIIGQSSGGAGGSGSYARKLVPASVIGTNQIVMIGAGGIGGVAGNNPGASGGDTTIGTVLCVAKGGQPGLGAASNSNGAGGLGGVPGTGDETQPGNPGETGPYSLISTIVVPGPRGGSTSLGQGGINGLAPASANSGAGGAGGVSVDNSGDAAGAPGSNGFVRITEFLSS